MRHHTFKLVKMSLITGGLKVYVEPSKMLGALLFVACSEIVAYEWVKKEQKLCYCNSFQFTSQQPSQNPDLLVSILIPKFRIKGLGGPWIGGWSGDKKPRRSVWKPGPAKQTSEECFYAFQRPKWFFRNSMLQHQRLVPDSTIISYE